MNISKFLSITLMLAAAGSMTSVAQSYYDDDIYYDASKDVKKKAEATQKKAAEGAKYQPQQYVGGIPVSDSNRRHGICG